MKNTFCGVACAIMVLAAALTAGYGRAFAQAAQVSTTEVVTSGVPGSGGEAVKASELPDMPASSLFFTLQQLGQINQALIGIYMPLFEQERSITGEGKGVGAEGVPIPPRSIRLSGLLYSSPEHWMIWLNGFRVTPGHLLPEIINISVESQQVYLEWFDYVLNKVISIRMKPHQVYDIDTGILLPG